jgi:hypothetical protein
LYKGWKGKQKEVKQANSGIRNAFHYDQYRILLKYLTVKVSDKICEVVLYTQFDITDTNGESCFKLCKKL